MYNGIRLLLNLGCFSPYPFSPPTDFLQGSIFSIEHTLILSWSKSKTLHERDMDFMVRTCWECVSDSCPHFRGWWWGVLLLIKSKTWTRPLLGQQVDLKTMSHVSTKLFYILRPMELFKMSTALPSRSAFIRHQRINKNSHCLVSMSFSFKWKKCHVKCYWMNIFITFIMTIFNCYSSN